MCQLENGALFRMKRGKVEELKTLFELIRKYKQASQETKNNCYVRVFEVVYQYAHIQGLMGFPLTAELIRCRAIKAGL